MTPKTFLISVILMVPTLGMSQKKSQTITFDALSTKTFGDSSFSITAKASSGLRVSFSSSNKLVATISDTTVTIVGAGTTVITASQAGDTTYNAATSVMQTLVVTKASQIITLPDFPVFTYGDPSYNIGGVSSSGLPLSYTVSDPEIGFVFNGGFIITGAGKCTITASQQGNNNFNAAASVSKNIFVEKASQVINFSTFLPKTYGNPPFTPQASAGSALPIVFQTSDPSIAAVQNGQVIIVGAGTVDIAATQIGNNNYAPAKTVVRTLTIQKATQNLAITSSSSVTYGDAPFTLTFASSSNLPAVFTTQYDTIASISGATATIQGAGTTVITVRVPGNQNYLPAQKTQSLVVKKASQTITFPSIPTQTFAGAPYVLMATASSGLPVTYTSSRKTVATVAKNVLLTQGFSTTAIVASQSGNVNYLPASNVTQNVTITGAGSVFQMVGSTHTGGNGKGTIFTLNSDGTNLTTSYNFPLGSNNLPNGGLLKGSDNKLYGLIAAGGNPGNGLIFSINSDGSGYTVLHNFSNADGSYPTGNLIEASNGYLYGTTMWGGLGVGVVFRIQKDGTNFSVLYQFNSSYYPIAGLTQATDGKLYGVTAQGGTLAYGTLFIINLDGSGYNEIVSFDATTKGSYPHGALIQGPDLFLYGVTASGGSSGNGVLFKVKTDGTSFTKLVEFDGTTKGATGTSTLLLGSDGKLYAMAQRGGVSNDGTIFSVSTDGTGFVKIFEFDGTTGSNPMGSLTEASDGYLYGMTNQGGTANLGTAFKIMKDGSNFSKLVDFQGANGASPQLGQLLEVQSGLFLGMTYQGGPSNAGIIFSVSSAGTLSVLKGFPQPPYLPEGLVADDQAAQLYGVTLAGGQYGSGTVFKVLPDGSNYSNITDIPGNNFSPVNIYSISDGSLWGIGVDGTTFGRVLFKLDQNQSNYQLIAMNDPAMGSDPRCLIDFSKDYIYGVCPLGGANNSGTIFKIKKDGTVVTKVVDIPGGNLGSRPYIQAIKHSNGSLYGVTHEGGDNNSGVVFKVDTVGVYSKIADLNQSVTGGYPESIIELNDGSLCIGLGDGGTNNGGTLFIVDENGSSRETIFNFSSQTGLGPISLVQSVQGYIYVALKSGGAQNKGSIIRVLPDGTGYLKILDFSNTNGSDPNTILFQKHSQNITAFDDIPQKQFLDPPFLLNATSSSGARIRFVSSDPSIASVEGYLVTIHKVGTVTISAQLPANGNYTASSLIQKTLTIIKSDQQLSFADIPQKTFGDTDFKLVTSTTSKLPISFASSNPAVATVSQGRVTVHAAGTTTITASVASDLNFNPVSPQQKQLTINQSNQVIQFDPLGTHYVKGGPFTAYASTCSGLPVTFLNNNSATATMSGNVVTIRAAGQAVITANAVGNNNFLEATPVQNTVTVIKLTQAISFDQLQDQPAEEKSVKVQKASATSGLPVVLTYTSSHISISRDTIVLQSPGAVTINANQQGDSLFLPAAQVSRTFCIIPSKPLLTVNYGDSVHVKLTSSAVQGNEWFKDGNLILGQNNQTITVTQSGSYTARVAIEGCSGASSNPQALVITGLEDSQNIRSVYPNPVKEWLFISLPQSDVDIRLFDMTGRELQKIQSDSSVTEINVQHLPSGVYIVRMQIGNTLSVSRFVKI